MPALNPSFYTPSVSEKTGRTSYKRKRPIKSERKRLLVTEGGKTRFALENKALARRTARARQGSAIAKGKFKDWTNQPHKETPEALKNGIIGMASRAGITDPELFRKLNKMDATKLQEMYNKDSLIFEVVFSYDGASVQEAGWNIEGIQVEKTEDLQYLLETYEQLYGAL